MSARLLALTALTMVAFAANSILNRLALADGLIGPGGFAAVRVLSGALVLVGLVAIRQRGLPRPPRPDGVAIAALAAYLLGFSFAYVSLDAGLGALVLFGGVQITMFAGAVAGGDRPAWTKWAGMVCALVGLALLSWPQGPVSAPPAALALMAVAALGWGVYSLLGRRAGDPLAATAWNFTYALPIVVCAALIWPDTVPATGPGLAWAVLSGAVTSGLGYALWYAVLPQVPTTTAALAQLTVPVIALALGAVLLAEALAPGVVLATALILGGIALGLRPARHNR